MYTPKDYKSPPSTPRQLRNTTHTLPNPITTTKTEYTNKNTCHFLNT